MSKETVNKLFAEAKENEELWSQLDSADNPDSVVRVGAAHGYDFTADDLNEVVEELRRAPLELSDDELDSVAGGLGDIKGEIGEFAKLHKVLTYQTGPGMVKMIGGYLGGSLGFKVE